MSSLTGNKKLLVPILLVAVLAVALVAAVPFSASAVIATDENDNSTTTAPENNSTATDQLDNSTATDQGNMTATEENNSTATEAQDTTTITGTIRVNGTQTVDDIDEDSLAVPESNATQIAVAEVANGTAVDTQLEVVQGFVVYTVTVVDVANQNMYHVIVDPSDGSVLYTSPGIPASSSVVDDAIEESASSNDGNNGMDDNNDDFDG